MGWQRAWAGSRYRVGEVEHTLPVLDYGQPAPCLLRPRVLSEMRTILAYAHELLAAQGIVHWLDMGTLLGACRYGGLTPWDDDIDLQVPLEHLDQLRALQSRIEGDGYRLLPSAGGCKLASGNPWCFPYVDFVMVAPQKDRMDQCFPLDREGKPTFRKAVQWPRECFCTNDVFPLGLIEVEGMELPVPQCGTTPDRTNVWPGGDDRSAASPLGPMAQSSFYDDGILLGLERGLTLLDGAALADCGHAVA